MIEPAAKEVVVYVPGLDGTDRLLYRQPRLRSEFDLRCLSYPQDSVHSYADLVALAEKPLQEAGGGTVLAESFGGAVALMLALRRPKLVRRMILVNTFAWFPRRAYIDLLARLGPYLPPKPSHPASRPIRGIFFFSKDVPAEDRRRWWDLTADVPMTAFGRRFGLIQALDLRPRLPEISTPTLVLAAPDDRVVPAAAGVSIARHLSNAKLIHPRVGHAGMIHPSIDVAALLQDPRYWPAVSAAATADIAAGSRPG